MIMYEASDAIDEAVPASATMNVIHFGEAPAMVPRSIAAMSPDCSATATPKRTMMTSPRGGKVTKLSVAPATISRRDSVEEVRHRHRLVGGRIDRAQTGGREDGGQGHDDDRQGQEQPEWVRQLVADLLDDDQQSYQPAEFGGAVRLLFGAGGVARHGCLLGRDGTPRCAGPSDSHVSAITSKRQVSWTDAVVSRPSHI